MADETFVDSRSLEWVASLYPGVFRKPLRFEEEGPRTTLLRMEPGAYIPRHLHPEGEEVFILEGRLQVDGDKWYEADGICMPRPAVRTRSQPTPARCY